MTKAEKKTAELNNEIPQRKYAFTILFPFANSKLNHLF